MTSLTVMQMTSKKIENKTASNITAMDF